MSSGHRKFGLWDNGRFCEEKDINNSRKNKNEYDSKEKTEVDDKK